MELILFIGIQAVGKSTFYHQRFENTHLRLNLDMLKTRHRERILFEACLAAKQPCVVDNTNVTVAERVRYIPPAQAAGFRVVGYYFQSKLAEALARNRERVLARPIPDKAVAATYSRLQLPNLGEGFDALYYVTLSTAGAFVVQEWADGL